MNLLELQRRMAEDVRRPLTAEFAMQPVTENGEWTAEIASTYIKPNPLLTSFDRLEIYNRQYWFRVIGAVSEDFPALNALLGNRRFDALVLAYLKDNPSTSFTLRDLGARLPDWLAQHLTLAGPRGQLALDVARLEWAYVEAFDRATLPALGMADLAGLGPDSTLSLQPHLQLLHLRYPVDDFVLAVHRDTQELDIVSNAASEHKTRRRWADLKIRRSPTYIAVHRLDNSVYYRRLEVEAFLLLSALHDGRSISESLQLAFQRSRQSSEQQAAMVQGYFAHASELGWLTMARTHES
jgi:hypothetical protein